VWPGDDLTARAEIAELTESDGDNVVELVITTVNQDGAEVFTGTATARIDP
jgi:acyl dehydratase